MTDRAVAERLRAQPYGQQSALQTLNSAVLDVEYEPGRIWIIYIHGGAWRDPRISADAFDRAQDLLLASPVKSHISGLASLNYRLSPHPEFPTGPDDPDHNAKHPDHILDVHKGIRYLQDRYRFGKNYILVGHSCGATLALQTAISNSWTFKVPLSDVARAAPKAILGLAGIYDVPALVEFHRDISVYNDFVTGAFGPRVQGGEDVWSTVSPAHAPLSAQAHRDTRLVMLAHSRDDTLIEWAQVEAMQRRLEREKRLPSSTMTVRGEHDEIWEHGTELARAIEACIEKTMPFLA